jgi:hypothetical protein
LNIFILEDDPDNYRIPIFNKLLKKHTLYIADDVIKAKAILNFMLKKNIPIDYIFLDHDLGGDIYVDSDDENCGVRVAEYIKEKKIESTVIVHSQNEIGAKNIKAVLPNAMIAPFPKLIKILKHSF